MLPEKFKERMERLLGEQSEAFFEAIGSGEAVRSFRVNSIKCSVGDFEAVDVQIDRRKAAFPSDAYYTEEKFPGRLSCHHSGMIYMQDPSAMATVHAVEIKEGARVLDSCSAPGGKTTQLAAAVGSRGVVVANEYEAKRCRILQSNVERMGCVNTVVVNLDTAVLAETYPAEFDVVLCDAPCSGEGMFRKNSLAIDEWSEENVKMCAERQREILTNVEKCVASNGCLIYSTCTFSLEENEMNVAWFLDKYPDFELCEVAEGLKKVTSDGICFDGCRYDMTKTRRFYPHVSAGEGQFIAVMRRNGGAMRENSSDVRAKGKKGGAPRPDKQEVEAIAAARNFIVENLLSNSFDEELYELAYLNGNVYVKPKIVLPKHSVFAAGVCVGELMGKRFVPHHQLFSAYGNCFKRKVLLDGESVQTAQYLRGLEIAVDGFESSCDKADGWAAVLIDGCAVGGGKVSNGVCKNHYPKGLRNQQ